MQDFTFTKTYTITFYQQKLLLYLYENHPNCIYYDYSNFYDKIRILKPIFEKLGNHPNYEEDENLEVQLEIVNEEIYNLYEIGLFINVDTSDSYTDFIFSQLGIEMSESLKKSMV